MRRALLLLCVLLAAGGASAEPVTVTARRIDYFSRLDPVQTAFGPLTFLGGLVLTSGSKDFGGFSGLRVAPDGARLDAVSDRAHWLTARLVHDGAKPVGIEAAELFPVLGASGKPLAGTRGGDTEALEIAEGIAWIPTERIHRVLQLDLAKGAQAARAIPVPGAKGMADLGNNAGIEALALVPDGQEKGTLLIVGEEPLAAGEDHPAWLLPGRTRKPARALKLKSRDGYAVTDMAFLPGGDLVVLERRYRPPFSLYMRLRRIALQTIREGAVLDGDVLLEASLAGQDIDNMEGLSAHRAADGGSVLTLISDDNFSGSQRTILLQFALTE